MKVKALLSVMVIAVAFAFAGCKEANTQADPEETAGPVDTTLTVQEITWSEMGSNTNDPVVFNPLESGDVVYNEREYEIEVESVTEDSIVLSVEGPLVESNSDGTVNLRADSIEEIELDAGESITLVSQTMDAGIRLEITYE